MSQTEPTTSRIEHQTTPIVFPDGWDLSTSWQRAQSERVEHGGWINDAERMIWLEKSDEPHRVVFVLSGRTLRVNCDCEGYHYRDWCAHVAKCWWDWINGRLAVSHLQTGREYQTPPEWLRVQLEGEPERYDGLTSAELDAYLSCELGDRGVREYARLTDRAPGTVGNLLRRAREKAGGRA